ncbi:sperm-associated antigen 5 [Acomys russatus]|uniref:sperm-associated antigen 5 n=1 Tax=Acomys russatus TaxID=60746 RepID=UPI0021E212FA|nr:sperm-associated antigen 5 [Acomys russatus]
MWRVKTLNLGLSPSPQPEKPAMGTSLREQAMRTPLRELKLQPEVHTDSGKGPPVFSSLTPFLRKLELKERHDKSSPVAFINPENSPPVDFINTENSFLSEHFSHPSKHIDTCQHDSDPIPESSSPLSTSEKAVEAVDDFVGEPVDESVVNTMVLLPFPLEQPQDLMLEAPLDAVGEAAPCMEDSSAEVVALKPEQPTSQDPPLRNSNTEAPEDLEPSKSVMNSSVAWLSPSAILSKNLPVDHVDPGEETVESRVIQETEESFPTLPEVVGLGEQALGASAEDVPSFSLASSLVEMVPQGAPGPTIEDAGRTPGSDAEAWMSPLAWLEKGVTMSVMLQNLRQRLSFPPVVQDAAVGNTPLSTCSVATSFTPPVPPEVGSKDSTSEAERLLLGCGPPDLTALSRHDLEANLLNSIVLLEALSHQLQTWKSQLTAPSWEAQDSSTQTDSSPCRVTKTPQHLQDSKEVKQALLQARDVMHSWVLVSRELLSLLHLSLAHMKEDRNAVSRESRRAETLVSSCSHVLKRLKAKLQSLRTEREEARRREEMALKGKDAAEAVLEAFRAHASQRINRLEQDLTSMQEFRSLLQEAQTQLRGLHTEQEELTQQAVSLTSALQQDWTSIQLDYRTWAALLGRSQELTKKLTAKSRQALHDRDAAVEGKKQVSKELEQVSACLEDCKGQIEQLKMENSRLVADLSAQLQILTSTDSQLKELQSQHSHCVQDLAVKEELLCQLTQSNKEQAAQWQKEEMELKHTQAKLQHQQAVLAKEVQDLKETLEFADQESQVVHLELGQMECQLKSTLQVLRERSLQCETLKDTVESLKAELASTITEHEKQAQAKTHKQSQELQLLTEQLQSLTLFLKAKLKDNRAESEIVLPSTACAPTQEHPLPDDCAISEQVLTAAADKAPEPAPVPLLGSAKSAFTRVASAASLQPAETPDLETSLAEMRAMLQDLRSLCSLLQESKEEAVGVLQRKICELQTRLQAQEEEHQEAQKAKDADMEKLNQALCLCYKNEKELQEVIQKQNEKILGQIDKSGELISLREEVTQLTRLLRHAETETKVLQEALEGQLDGSCQPMATSWIQEKVSLSQEVDKLRAMFLEMKNENAKLVAKYQSHRTILEENLRRSDTELKKLDDTIQHIYKILLSVPEVVKSCKELHGLLDFLS